MTKIKKYVEKIEDELEGAKEYAEKYIEYKAMGNMSRDNMSRANKYKELANTELQHAMTIHQFSVEDVEELKKVYTPPVEMEKKWEESHKEYVEKSAWIKQMLAM